MKPEERSALQANGVLNSKLDRRALVRRGAGLGAGAAFAATLIGRTAAQTSASAGYGNTAKGPKVDKLTMWTKASKSASPQQYQAITNLAQSYTKQVGTPVEVVTIPDPDFRNKLRLSAPHGQGPDVFGPIAHDWIGEIAYEDIAMPIPDGAIDHKDDFIPVSFQVASVNGKLYGMPLFVETIGLIYNKALLTDPPKTWDELVTVATKLTQGKTYGFGMPLLEPYNEGAFFMGMGSYVFKYVNGNWDTNDIGLNNPDGVAATQFLRDMYWKKQPPLPPAAIDKNSMHSAQEAMQEAGQLAMYLDGPWREGPLQKAKINYGAAPLPTLPDGKPMKPFLGLQLWAASAYSQHKDAALDFILFATGTQSMAEQYNGYFEAPARRSALESKEVQANPANAVWMDIAAGAVPMPNIPAMQSVWTPWQNAMVAIIPKNLADDKIKPVLDQAVAQMQKAIKQVES